MKIPQTDAAGDTSRDELDGVALNQLITDKEIIDTVVSNVFGSRKWSSAIKIGDIWLSIPSRIISIYDPYETNPEEVWKDPRFIPDDRVRILKDIGITKANPVNKDPLEKFVGFSTPSIENSVINSESLGRLTNLVVQNNKSADKIFVLKFECRDMSIQNNIRPVLAQALVSPFLPIHNADLNQIVNPPDENPDLFINSNKAFIDSNTGQFKWGSLGTTSSIDETKLSQINLVNYKKYVSKNGLSAQEQTTLQQELLRVRAYWEIPFYVQLIDFSIQSIPDKRNAYQLSLTVRPVSLEPAYGGTPLYIKTDEALQRQISSNTILEKNYKGDTKLIRNISKMLGLNPNDTDEEFHYNSERKDYNLFDEKFDTQINKIVDTTNPLSHAVTFKINTDQKHPGLVEHDKSITGCSSLSSTTGQIVSNTSLNNFAPTSLTPFSASLLINNNGTIAADVVTLKVSSYGGNSSSINNYFRLITNTYNLNKYKNNSIITAIKPSNRHPTFKFSLLPYINTQTGKPKTDFKLLQYNLKQFFKPGTDVTPASGTGEGYELRKALFAQLLIKENADIICLEELGNTDYSISELKQYIKDISEIDYNVIHTSNKTAISSGNINETIGIGLLSKYPATAESIDLSKKIDKYLLNQNIFAKSGIIQFNTNLSLGIKYKELIPDSRPILKVTITRPEDNTNLVVFVCHFRSKLKTDNEIFRKFESFCLIDEILRLPEDQPYIIVGDFNYDLYSLDSIDLSSFNNNVLVYDKTNKTFKHKFRTIGDAGEIDKVRGEDLSALWYGTLDLILADNRETISQKLDFSTPGILDIDSRIQKYYEILYKDNIQNILKRTLVFSSLKEKYSASTKEVIENFKLQGNPRITKDTTPEDQTGTGTFFNVETNKEDPTIVSSMGFSIIDNIFYSAHFFQNTNLIYEPNKTTIVNNYNDKGVYINNPKDITSKIKIPDRNISPIEYFTKGIVPIKENTEFRKKTQYSDHFPVSSIFRWNIIEPSNDENAIDPLEKVKQYFSTGIKLPSPIVPKSSNASSTIIQSANEIECNEIEIFPFPNVITQKIKNFTDLFKGIDSAQDLILYKTTTNPTIRLIIGIFFSKIANKYIFIYTDISTTNTFVPLCLEANITNTDIIESHIKELYSSNLTATAIEALAAILETEITKETVNLENLDILTNIPTRDIGEKIDKSLFYQYYNLLDNFSEISLGPGEVSSNISQCQPFRNYYLPLLEEFSEEVRKFDWKYNFEIDKFGSFIFNTKNVNQEDYKLYFSRKSPNRFGSTFLYSVTRAIQMLARFNSGEPAVSLARYLGDIANSVLYNSERITLKSDKIMQIKNCTYEQSLNILINNEPINGEIPKGGIKFTGNYQTNGVVTRNVVSAEIIYYLATQIAIILTLLDENFRDEIVNTSTAGIDPVLDSKGNVLPLDKYRDIMFKEIKFRANVFFQNQPVNYTKYVKIIQRYISLNFATKKEKENNNPNFAQQGQPKYYTSVSELIADYNKDLNHMIDKIYFLYVALEPIKIIEAI